jgi:arylsulfatase A-like enzyme
MKTPILALFFFLTASIVQATTQPNILWVLTDDQRYDSIAVFNRIMLGQEESKLGYVESPTIDELAERGTTFINTYCQAQGCAPSRASMHYGRYQFRTGIYEFEWHNKEAEHTRPTLPEQMARYGYQTVHVGKLGVRVRTTESGELRTHPIYENDIYFRPLWNDGFTDWNKGEVTSVNGIQLDEPVHCDWIYSPDGTIEYTGKGLNSIPGLENQSRTVDEKYDFLRKRNSRTPATWGSGEIIGGVSSQPAGKTRDGAYTSELIRFLENPDRDLTVGSMTYRGVDPTRPLFLHIGYDFPHTPVLPPKSFRDRFQDKVYRIPEFDPAELDRLPPQLRNLVLQSESDHYSDADKQQMVQDYYAFCAYGDSLIGQAVRAFVDYSERQEQPWMILYVCGDHGWKLNEHGAIYKFSPWEIDTRTPVIVVSSDKEAFPAGKVVTDIVELVDLAPTALVAAGADIHSTEYDYLDGYDLAGVVSGDLPARDYTLSESHAVTGPRATIRTAEYMFSLRSRPDKVRGRNMLWALSASYEELEPVLYDLTRDPEERYNLAFDRDHQAIAQAMKEKLLDIVLGDNRVEVNWGEAGAGTEVFRSNYAPGSDDKKLPLPTPGVAADVTDS